MQGFADCCWKIPKKSHAQSAAGADGMPLVALRCSVLWAVNSRWWRCCNAATNSGKGAYHIAPQLQILRRLFSCLCRASVGAGAVPVILASRAPILRIPVGNCRIASLCSALLCSDVILREDRARVQNLFQKPGCLAGWPSQARVSILLCPLILLGKPST